MTDIVQKNEPVLRETAVDVPLDEITSTAFQNVLLEMFETLQSQNDGVALAAPQISVSKRVFIVSRKAYEDEDGNIPEGKDVRTVFINPKIVKQSKKRAWMEEGCLSVRWLYGKTYRYKNTTVEAYDENGERFTFGGGKLLAQIFQHEIDHLNGILFTDHAEDVHEISDKEKQKIENENSER